MNHRAGSDLISQYGVVNKFCEFYFRDVYLYTSCKMYICFTNKLYLSSNTIEKGDILVSLKLVLKQMGYFVYAVL